MADDQKVFLGSYGAFMLGYNLERLEWALATVSDASQIAGFMLPFRVLSLFHSFEDIGTEAEWWHNWLSNLPPGPLSDKDKNSLRSIRTRWETKIQERLSDMVLITPTTLLKTKAILQGISGLLSESELAILTPAEVSDLIESCWCVVIGSATSAEYMALRAAESLLRRWHKHKTGQSISRETWGVVLDRLTEQYPEERNRPNEISLLAYLKLRRNEIAHPERVSFLLDAEATLLNVCILIRGMAEFFSKLPVGQIGESQLSMLDTEAQGQTVDNGA